MADLGIYGSLQDIGSSVGQFAQQKVAKEALLKQAAAQRQNKLQDAIALAQATAEAKAQADPLKVLLDLSKISEATGLSIEQLTGQQAQQTAPVVAPSTPKGQGIQSQFSTGSPQIFQAQPKKEPKPGDLIEAGFKRTPFGGFQSTKLERVKKTASQEKREVEITELEAGIKNLIESFRGAREETRGAFGVGERGLTGRIGGLLAVGKGKIGESPKVNVFQDRIKAFATTVAKAAGEVRPTDKDIERFIGTLPTIEKSDEENEIIIKGLINDLKARGAKVLWAKVTSGKQEGVTPSGVKFTFKPMGK